MWEVRWPPPPMCNAFFVRVASIRFLTQDSLDQQALVTYKINKVSITLVYTPLKGYLCADKFFGDQFPPVPPPPVTVP